ncbi:hypothetical protein EX30DRAFT_173645 [Ascodesmis nigricans]|uniref:C2H2-type domain-containing protein n=1 Tax=Ascodesmis nigricans TaxID=341454 RepID=A0A4S2MLU9_9PEZI|nr:hypothetical protein EX30DRAFT_173645 [Ascodesmis nigricans]
MSSTTITTASPYNMDMNNPDIDFLASTPQIYQSGNFPVIISAHRYHDSQTHYESELPASPRPREECQPSGEQDPLLDAWLSTDNQSNMERFVDNEPLPAFIARAAGCNSVLTAHVPIETGHAISAYSQSQQSYGPAYDTGRQRVPQFVRSEASSEEDHKFNYDPERWLSYQSVDNGPSMLQRPRRLPDEDFDLSFGIPPPPPLDENHPFSPSFLEVFHLGAPSPQEVVGCEEEEDCNDDDDEALSFPSSPGDNSSGSNSYIDDIPMPHTNKKIIELLSGPPEIASESQHPSPTPNKPPISRPKHTTTSTSTSTSTAHRKTTQGPGPQRQLHRGRRAIPSEPYRPSNRRTAAPERPFRCLYRFAGCEYLFKAKNEWKRHIITQHTQPFTWKCDEPMCNEKGKRAFKRKDLYGAHLKRCHAPNDKPHGGKEHPAYLKVFEVWWKTTVPELQDKAKMLDRLHPERARCVFCGRLFKEDKAWDQMLEHVGQHYEGHGDELEEGRGEVDENLIEWSLKHKVIRRLFPRVMKTMGQDGQEEFLEYELVDNDRRKRGKK